METYKKSLQSQIKWMAIGLVVSLIVVVSLLVYSNQQMNQSHIGDFVHGVQTGLSVTLFGVFIFRIMSIKNTLKNESSIKRSYIKAHDERSQFILSKVGSISFNMEMFVIFLGVIVSGFFNETISLTLLAVLAIKAVLKVVLGRYYERVI